MSGVQGRGVGVSSDGRSVLGGPDLGDPVLAPMIPTDFRRTVARHGGRVASSGRGAVHRRQRLIGRSRSHTAAMPARTSW